MDNVFVRDGECGEDIIGGYLSVGPSGSESSCIT